MDYVKECNKYAKDIIRGDIDACQYIKNVCVQYFKNIRKKDKWVFDSQKANRACEIIETFKLNVGTFAGQKIKLLPWQIFLICNLFGFVSKDDRKVRKYQKSFVLIPKKNGKSTLIAAISLYMTFCEGEKRAETYILAAKKEQAKIVFNACQDMARLSGLLSLITTVKNKNIITGVENSECKDLTVGSSIRALSSDKKEDGLIPHCVIADELHQHKNGDLLDIVSRGIRGTTVRKSPMILIISTEGVYADNHVFDLEKRAAQFIANNPDEDERTFPLIYTLDEEDYEKEITKELIIKANPSSPVLIDPDYLYNLYKVEAKKGEITKAQFFTKHLNIRQSDLLEQWVSKKELEAITEDIPIEELAKYPVHMGFDMGNKRDLTSICYIFDRSEDGLPHYMYFRCYVPEGFTSENSRSELKDTFKLYKNCPTYIETYGETRNDNFVHDDILYFVTENRLKIQYVSYDVWQANNIVDFLNEYYETLGIENMAPVPMNTQTKTTLIDYLNALILEKKILIQKCEFLKWQFLSAKLTVTPKRRYDLTKDLKTGMIDSVFAALCACDTLSKRNDGVELAFGIDIDL